MRRASIGLLTGAWCLGAGAALAAEAEPVPSYDWPFEGVFGHFDQAALQRGLQVYREVCSSCHSLRLIAFRNLADLGYDEEEVKAIAAQQTVVDGPNDEGEMFERAGEPADYFPSPFPNEEAAEAANNGVAPPDLSLMAKARVGGPSYLRALLTGYEEAPAEVEVLAGQYYNAYFPGKVIVMPPPLFEDAVEYQDGTEATVDQMAADVSSFLMWTAEPNMERRKQMGIKVMLFLFVFTGVLYAVKRKVWADVH